MTKITLNKERVDAVRKFADELAEAKRTQHANDNRKESKRNETGLFAEAALEDLLGIDIIEYSIGNSYSYDHPDIAEYGVGVKGVTKSNDPMINIKNHYSQIICYVYPQRDGSVDVNIMGIASPDVLNTYQDSSLIKDERARAKGTKTCITPEGMAHLDPVNTIEDLKAHTHFWEEYQSAKASEPSVICPDCGSVMIARQGKWGSFYGCTNFPNCRKTVKIVARAS